MAETHYFEQECQFFDIARRSFIPLRDKMVFGRAVGGEGFADDRFSADRALSAQHCRIHFFEGDVFIEDLNSSNKTFINGNPIVALTRVRLRRFDLIEFGNQRFIFTSKQELPPAYQGNLAVRQAVVDEKKRAANNKYSPLAADPSTRLASSIVTVFVMSVGFAYFPNFSSYQPHNPYKILAEVVLIAATVSALFLFTHQYLVKHLLKKKLQKQILAVVTGLFSGLMLMVVLGLVGVPTQLDQNRLLRDCSGVIEPKNLLWCELWVEQNKNGAYSGLSSETQVEITAALKRAKK